MRHLAANPACVLFWRDVSALHWLPFAICWINWLSQPNSLFRSKSGMNMLDVNQQSLNRLRTLV